MPDSATKSRSQVKDLGTSLSAIFDTAKCRQCQGRVKLNEATTFVMDCVLKAVLTMPLEKRARGFIGLAGESSFWKTEFPPLVRTAVDGHVGIMTRMILSQTSSTPVAISGDQYSISLCFFSSQEEAGSWIEEQNSSRQVPPAAVRKRVLAKDEIADGPSEIPLALSDAPPQNESVSEDDQQSKSQLSVAERFKLFVQEIMRDVKSDYTSKKELFLELNHNLRQSAASALQAPFNSHLHTMPQSTPADKKTIAIWVNAQLRELGLAIRCPRTARPSVLIADVKEGRSKIGRFRFENRDESGAKQRTSTSEALPELELMEDLPRREPIIEWTVRVRDQQQDKGRS